MKILVKRINRQVQVVRVGKQGKPGATGPQGPKGDQGDPATNLVQSVNGKQGVVVLNATDVGADPTGSASQALQDAKDYTDTEVSTLNSSLATVAKTGSYNDLSNKPTIPSIAGLATEAQVQDVQDNLDAHEADTDNPHSVTKAQVGLGNVSNLAPADMPVSIAQQTALDLVGFKPEDFGAVGDGVADDTLAVQGALDAAGGGTALLTGVYGFNATLTVPPNTTVTGGGELKLIPGYTLSQVTYRSGSPMYPYLHISEDNVRIVNIKVAGTTADTRAQRHVGILFSDCSDGLAENVSTEDTNWDPTLATTSSPLGYGLGTVRASNITIRGGRFVKGGYQNIGIADGSRDILVDGVYCGESWRTSFQIHRDVWDVVVTNSTIENVSPTAHSAFTIHPDPTGGSPSGRVTISNTRIVAEVDPNLNVRGGLQLVDNIEGLTLTDVTIESNRWGCYLMGDDITLKNVSVVSLERAVQIVGNRVSIIGGNYYIPVNGVAPMCVDVSPASNDVSIVGAVIRTDMTTISKGINAGGVNNYISGCVIHGRSYGIHFPFNSIREATVVNNKVTSSVNNAIDFQVNSASPAGMSLIISGNTVLGPSTYRAIVIQSNIIGPIVHGNVVLGGNVGVRITSAASKAIVKDNNLLGATSGQWVEALDSIIADNLLP